MKTLWFLMQQYTHPHKILMNKCPKCNNGVIAGTTHYSCDLQNVFVSRANSNFSHVSTLFSSGGFESMLKQTQTTTFRNGLWKCGDKIRRLWYCANNAFCTSCFNNQPNNNHSLQKCISKHWRWHLLSAWIGFLQPRTKQLVCIIILPCTYVQIPITLQCSQ